MGPLQTAFQKAKDQLQAAIGLRNSLILLKDTTRAREQRKVERQDLQEKVSGARIEVAEADACRAAKLKRQRNRRVSNGARETKRKEAADARKAKAKEQIQRR